MRDRIALVTGAGGGIGRAKALRLAKEDAAVVVADVDEEGGAQTIHSIEAVGGRGASVRANVATEAGAREIVEFAAQSIPRALAPYHRPQPARRNALYALRLPRDAPSGRRCDRQHLLDGGIGYRPHDAPEHAAAKAGVARLTAALTPPKEELGARVNCICPSWVETQAVREA